MAKKKTENPEVEVPEVVFEEENKDLFGKKNADKEDYAEGINSSYMDVWDYMEETMEAGVDLGAAVLGVSGAVVGSCCRYCCRSVQRLVPFCS